MLTRRQFLIGSAAALTSAVLSRRLLASTGGSGSFTPPSPWIISSPSAATIQSNLASMIAGNAITVTVGTPQEVGYRPASIYNALWTRDNAYTLWHYPALKTAAQRRQFVTYTLAQRSTASTPNPNGGFFPADFIADRIDSAGVVTFLNAGASTYGNLPIFDGIAMVILALWSDWNLTGDLTTYTASKAAIDACLAAIPRSANGCVYSNPASPSADYGFTDGILKTGDCAYGTALQAWAYKMMSEMANEGGVGAYSTLRAAAQSGLTTLRKANGFYMGSSGNNSPVDDVWATALIVAESLVSSDTNRRSSAQAIADAYSGATITQFGLVRHLPIGQFWSGTSITTGTYQNGGFWLTPLWDCVRAVDLVNPTLARTWAAEAMTQLNDERTAEGTWANVPYEWHNYLVGVGAKGYTASAALVNRFV